MAPWRRPRTASAGSGLVLSIRLSAWWFAPSDQAGDWSDHVDLSNRLLGDDPAEIIEALAAAAREGASPADLADLQARRRAGHLSAPWRGRRAGYARCYTRRIGNRNGAGRSLGRDPHRARLQAALADDDERQALGIAVLLTGGVDSSTSDSGPLTRHAGSSQASRRLGSLGSRSMTSSIFVAYWTIGRRTTAPYLRGQRQHNDL